MTGRTLVAGVGNVFLRDDAFGVEVVRLLADHPVPDGVEIRDFGIRGVHLVYDLLNGCDLFVLVDAADAEIADLHAVRHRMAGQQPDHLDAEGIVAQEHIAHARHQRPPGHPVPSILLASYGSTSSGMK